MAILDSFEARFLVANLKVKAMGHFAQKILQIFTIYCLFISNFKRKMKLKHKHTLKLEYHSFLPSTATELDVQILNI